jgi:hypothetical protein
MGHPGNSAREVGGREQLALAGGPRRTTISRRHFPDSFPASPDGSLKDVFPAAGVGMRRIRLRRYQADWINRTSGV